MLSATWLACRSEEKARAAMDLIQAESPEADLGFVSLDLADLTSVRSAARIAAAEPRIDVLINNAAIFEAHPVLEVYQS